MDHDTAIEAYKTLARQGREEKFYKNFTRDSYVTLRVSSTSMVLDYWCNTVRGYIMYDMKTGQKSASFGMQSWCLVSGRVFALLQQWELETTPTVTTPDEEPQEEIPTETIPGVWTPVHAEAGCIPRTMQDRRDLDALWGI